MTDVAWNWLLLTLVCIATQAFFSMLEMAYVSFNRVKLHYYVSENMKRAVWIQKLLQDPSKLFGTTLVGVNIALQIGSECSRQLLDSLNIHANYAPLIQGFVVLIFAELSPMMAARKYAENVALLGSPLIYLTSLILTPVTWLIGVLTSLASKVFGGFEKDKNIFLSREELQKAFEFHEGGERASSMQFSDLISNIFDIKSWSAQDLMTPVYMIPKIPAHTTVSQMRQRLLKHPVEFLPIYFQSQHHIIGIAFTKDLVNITEGEKTVRSYARPPWFILQSTTVIQVLQQFKKNNQDVAIVLNKQGKAIGILSLNDIIAKVFRAKTRGTFLKRKERAPFIQKKFPGNMPIYKVNKKYNTSFPQDEANTLAQLMTKHLAHKPEKGDCVKIGDFELMVEKTTLLGIKEVIIRSLS